MSYSLYGIANCDTVKKVRLALEKKGIAYEFIDFKKAPPTTKMIQDWAQFLAGELPVNKRGTTFRKIKTDWEAATGAAQMDLLLQNPSAIKRPILQQGPKVLMIGHEIETIEKLKA